MAKHPDVERLSQTTDRLKSTNMYVYKYNTQYVHIYIYIYRYSVCWIQETHS